jgi:outer membrane immunogenic protein
VARLNARSHTATQPENPRSASFVTGRQIVPGPNGNYPLLCRYVLTLVAPMSKRLFSIAAGAVALATGGAAFAADMPVKAPPPPPAPVPYTWIGFYIRASAGPNWSWNDVEPSGTVAFTNPGFSANAPSTAAAQIAATPLALSTSANGFIGGGQLGYDPRWDRFVLGVEADFSSLTGRGFNNSNQFVQIGAATIAQSCTFTPTGCAILFPSAAAGTASKTLTGWALGAGIETSWSVKAEYLRFDLGKYATTPLAGTVGVVPLTTINAASAAKFQGDLVRAGLNYQFH